ncbi:MAG: ABC transporter permease [Chloroflexota bacterium]
MLANLYRYRRYILSNAWLDLRRQYAGTGLGALWNILLPLAEIAIYATIFVQVMNLRAPGKSSYAFVLYMCSGLFPWQTFSRAISMGSNALIANTHYLQQLALPEEVFVARQVLSDALALMIYLALLVLIGPLLGQPPGWTNLLLPLVGCLFQFFAFGLALFLAVLRVFFQDVGHALGVVLRMWMWLSPVIWVETILSPQALAVLRWNPAYPYLVGFHDLFLQHQVPSWSTWGQMLAWALASTFLGALVLRRLRPELRDIL